MLTAIPLDISGADNFRPVDRRTESGTCGVDSWAVSGGCGVIVGPGGVPAGAASPDTIFRSRGAS